MKKPEIRPVRKGNFRYRKGSLRSSRGVALLMVLWVMTILSVVVTEFCLGMRTEVNMTRNYQEELHLYAAAEGGIQRAIVELFYKHDPRVQQIRKSMSEGEKPAESMEWVTDGRDYQISFDRADCWVRIIGEAGKININRATDRTLRRILGNLGLEGEARDVVVDSILDWRDPDDLYRLNGAENDYYQSLPEPYRCKNGNLDSVEELLLVRGVTPDLFYGKRGKGKENEEAGYGPIGLKDIFSVYATGEQIDINSATLPVLHVALGLPMGLCRLIIQAREEKSFENLQDLLQRVPELVPLREQVVGLVLFRSPNPYYTIEARGKGKGEGGFVRALKVIVRVDPREKEGYRIVQWMDFIL